MKRHAISDRTAIVTDRTEPKNCGQPVPTEQSIFIVMKAKDDEHVPLEEINLQYQKTWLMDV